MNEKDLQKLDDKLEEAKKQANISSLVKSQIQSQYETNKQQLVNNEDFKKLTQEITERTAKAELGKDMLEVLSQEQKNELALYVLECEKQQIEYRKKHEKKVILEEVQAEVFNKKVEALKKKYGYLYKKDENGNIINFIPSKAYNKYRAFCHWWENTTDGFKKIVKGTLKVLFWSAIIGLIVLFGYKLFDWISNANIPN